MMSTKFHTKTMMSKQSEGKKFHTKTTMTRNEDEEGEIPNPEASSMDNMGNRDEPNRTLYTCLRKGVKWRVDLSKTTEILIKKK